MASITRLFSVALMSMMVLAASGTVSADSGAEMQKAVLVTGASTGIGRKIAEDLAEQGYFVYAGARKAADIDDGTVRVNWTDVHVDHPDLLAFLDA